MSALVQDLSVVVDGVAGSPLVDDDPLIRAVIISLFTWRRAKPDDAVDGGPCREHRVVHVVVSMHSVSAN